MIFSKFEATGNDFILVRALEGWKDPAPGWIAFLCDRRLGIGADGVIFLVGSGVADIGMRMFNPDGSEAEMCGNGIRALALFAMKLNLTTGDFVDVETKAGVKRVRHLGKAGSEHLFEVSMGVPSLKKGDIPMRGDPEEDAVGVRIDMDDHRPLTATCVSMGNPHCVILIEDPGELSNLPLERIGSSIENNSLFPSKTNVEFVFVEGPEKLTVRVWERGAGETLSCGTGACAALVAASVNGFSRRRATVRLPGGFLEVDWKDEVFMTGPAKEVFEGRLKEEYEII